MSISIGKVLFYSSVCIGVSSFAGGIVGFISAFFSSQVKCLSYKEIKKEVNRGVNSLQSCPQLTQAIIIETVFNKIIYKINIFTSNIKYPFSKFSIFFMNKKIISFSEMINKIPLLFIKKDLEMCEEQKNYYKNMRKKISLYKKILPTTFQRIVSIPIQWSFFTTTKIILMATLFFLRKMRISTVHLNTLYLRNKTKLEEINNGPISLIKELNDISIFQSFDHILASRKI